MLFIMNGLLYHPISIELHVLTLVLNLIDSSLSLFHSFAATFLSWLWKWDLLIEMRPKCGLFHQFGPHADQVRNCRPLWKQCLPPGEKRIACWYLSKESSNQEQEHCPLSYLPKATRSTGSTPEANSITQHSTYACVPTAARNAKSNLLIKLTQHPFRCTNRGKELKYRPSMELKELPIESELCEPIDTQTNKISIQLFWSLARWK